MYQKESNTPLIYASEIGQYHYCPVSWYLQRCGYKPDSRHLDRGKHKHRSIGKILINVEKQRYRSKILFYFGLCCLLISFLFFFIEVVL